MQCKVNDLSALVNGELTGDAEMIVSGVADVGDAGPSDVVLAEDQRYFDLAAASDAACIVTGKKTDISGGGKCVIVVDDPVTAFFTIVAHIKPAKPLPVIGISPSAVIEKSAVVGEKVSIGANCYIGGGASIADGVVLFPGVYIGDGAYIGNDSVLHPGVVVYGDCRVGKRVTLHAGVVVGADGFGYKPCESGLMKLPHVGIVEIEDDVEIGANSTIDRAKLGSTVIGKGTKIDNLVHIAHNVKIGKHCVVVALSGIAGSVAIGDGSMLAAQTGVKDHVKIGNGCKVAARAGVIGDIPDGSVVSGFPARDHRQEKRSEAMRFRLPELMERLRALEKQVEQLGRRKENGCNDDSKV